MRVIFMGTPDFAVSTLEAVAGAGHEICLVVTQPDKPRGRGREMQAPPVKEWAVRRDIPVFQPPRIREPEAVAVLERYPADIIIVAAFGQILPKEVLELPGLGCVNVHASLLPKYRGAAPIQWAVINGDAFSGVTTMQMGEGLDDGDILLMKEVALRADETGGSLFDRLAAEGGRLCVETMEGLQQGSITPTPQDESKATHVGMIKKSMGRMNFEQSAVELERLIRGLNPWPGTFTSFQGKTLKIWRARVEEALPVSAAGADAAVARGLMIPAEESRVPGQICLVSDTEFWVETGAGYLVPEELQLEGRKRMPVREFLRGRKVSAGEMLGEPAQ